MGSVIDLPTDRLFVDGQWVEPREGGVDDVVNPATEDAFARVGLGTSTDVDHAVAAARRAFDDGPWPRLDRRDRSRVLRRFAEALASRRDGLVDLVVREVGTTRSAAEGHQVGLPLEHLHHWAEVAGRRLDEAHPPELSPRRDGSLWLGGWVVRREPAGVVAAITAFNFPLLLTAMKLGPALATGNTVVLKPAPQAPLTALLIARAAQEAELPPGVLNVVTGGADVGERLSASPDVDVLSFTGSDAVGARIQAQAAPTLKRLLLELGGKSPLIVRRDADLDLASTLAVQHIIFNAGQGCAMCSRHLVHRDVVDAYVDAVVDRLGEVRVGDPADPAVGMGPVIGSDALARIERLVDDTLERGGKAVAGGSRTDGLHRGWFHDPTLIVDVDNAWPIARTEVFGPVATVTTFGTDDEAVTIANDSPYGLDGHVVSADAGAAYELACRLRTGGVSINGGAGWTNPAVPFGGVRRSGLGRENGDDVLREYTEAKTIKFHAG